MRQTLYGRLKDKEFSPKHVAEVGVYVPETSNVYEYACTGVRCTLVEPDPEAAAALRTRFSGYENVVLHAVAVYDKRGTLELVRGGASTYAAVIDQSPAKVNDQLEAAPGDRFLVEAVPFDAIDDGSIDLLSVDIEGGEWFVLKHLVSRPAVISVETHGGLYRNPYLSQISDWMYRNGYEVWYKDKSDSVYVRSDVLPVSTWDRTRLLSANLKLYLKTIEKQATRLLRRGKFWRQHRESHRIPSEPGPDRPATGKSGARGGESPAISSRHVIDIVLGLAARRAGELDRDRISIAEIGAGSGTFARALSKSLSERGLEFQYDCFDIEPEQINGQDMTLSCRFMDAQQPFALGRTYDLIIAIELIEHLESPFHFLRELAQISRIGTTVLVTTPNTLSLRSRGRHFMTGCDDYFRRPYNEHWLNMGHVNPINPIQLNYVARKNGFRIAGIHTNRYTAGSLLLTPFVPLMYVFSYLHYMLRERGSGQRARNRVLLSLLFRPALLFGKIAIFEMRKEQPGIAAPDIWHRPDDRFSA